MQCLHGPIVVAAAGLFVMSASASGAVIYVDDDAELMGNGQSWETPYKYLQDALAIAMPEDEIRVAQGTYWPDRAEYDPGLLGDRDATFQLLNDVTLLGGYAGLGAEDPDARDVSLYETILSGDLTGDDEPEFVNYEDNSYHVVTASGVSATAVLDGFTIEGGFAEGRNGGGMYFEAGSPTIRDCTFRRNLAAGAEAHWTGLGGGLYVAGVGAPVLERCSFIGNRASGEFSDLTGGGGATFAIDTALTLNECNFEENHASFRGGGLMTWRGEAELTRCAFTNNKVAGDPFDSQGGGIFLTVTDVTITDSQFTGNSADWGGAVCELSGGSATIVNSDFTGNEAMTSGGAVMLWLVPHVTIVNAEFSTNAAEYGGALYLFGIGDATLTNVLFTRNEAETGGAILNYNALPILTNVTLADNLASVEGGGMYNSVSSFPSVRNSIFWGNEGGQIVDDDTSTTTVDFCDVQDGWPGKGNIAVDAAFVDPENGDYRLAVGSPCIDAAHNNAVPPDSHDLDDDLDFAERVPRDLDDNPRFADVEDAEDTGCGSPAVVDMGAYEFEGIPDEPVYVGDVTGDGLVTFDDLLEVLSAWGACADDCCMADVDFDADVGFDDLLLVLSNWS